MANLTTVGTVTGTTVSGAGQALTPSAMNGDVPRDNRRMVLNVAGANIANIKAGDSFTLAGVNAVHQIDKSDT
ncbi:P22 phage major capsid protein family protein, partial [Lacticaseibacillus paracasei]